MQKMKASIFNRLWFVLLVIVLLLLQPGVLFAADRVIGLVGSPDLDSGFYKKHMSVENETKVLACTFYEGELEGHQVVLVSSGVGKVNAAMATALLLSGFPVKEVITWGAGGAVDPALNPGDVIIANKVGFHDLGHLSRKGFVPFTPESQRDGSSLPLFMDSNRKLRKLAVTVSKEEDLISNLTSLVEGEEPVNIAEGIIVSGDQFIASGDKRDDLRMRYGASLCDMESAAVAQVCYESGVPFLAVRAVSDSAERGAILDYKKFGKLATKNAFYVVRAVLGKKKVQSGK